MTTYTSLEQKVLRALPGFFNYDTAEAEMSDNAVAMDLDEIADAAGLSIVSAKGVVGSLYKKGCLEDIEIGNGRGTMAIGVTDSGIEAAYAARAAQAPAPKPKPKAKPAAAPTSKVVYDSLYEAFDHFNAELFDGALEVPMIVLHRKRGAHGYFWNQMWQAGDDARPEIALSPESMGRGPKEVLATLVHEMVHQWDAVYGNVPSYGHGKTWADKMEQVGLTPTATGKPGGKKTGRKVTHMIDAGGPFEVAYAALIAKGKIDLSWVGKNSGVGQRKRDESKVPHVCPCCQTKVWGKRGIRVRCEPCDERLVAQW